MEPRRERRRRRARRRNYAALTTMMVVLLAVAAGLALRSPTSSSPRAHAGALTSTAPPPPTTLAATTLAATTTTEPDPGALPQTPDRPEPASPRLTLRTQQLWSAIVADDPTSAMGFFFPLGAYIQVKAIANPDQDWHNRLVAAYTQDIHAWHAQLGANPGATQLVGLDVPNDQAQWILPGVESNKGSYWRVYGAILRYQTGTQQASFTIASMISWRGDWYIVHLASIR